MRFATTYNWFRIHLQFIIYINLVASQTNNSTRPLTGLRISSLKIEYFPTEATTRLEHFLEAHEVPEKNDVMINIAVISPTRLPTSQPSRQPWIKPTTQPSRQPTNQPTRQPTRQPTTQPSRQPWTKPTAQPTRQPTTQPSRQPWTKPTAQPTRQPTTQLRRREIFNEHLLAVLDHG